MSDHKKVNSSIVFELNIWHLSRMFFSFLWINIIITLLFCGALMYSAESYFAKSAGTGFVPETFTPFEGFKVPELTSFLLPENTKAAARGFNIQTQDNSFWKGLDSMQYKAVFPSGEILAYNVGETSAIFLKLLITLMIFELIFLLRSIGKGSRAMHRALRPIEELTQTARIINQPQTARPDVQLRDLTGTIDTINASHLDTRLSIDSSQSELKELAGAINGMLDRINEAYRSQVRFVSDASHELRTPIAVIQGYVNLLDRWGKNDEKALQESIEAIKSEADSMKELVEQLLFLARGDNDSMRLNLEDVDTGELVEEVIREAEMIDPAHTFVCRMNAGGVILADAALIKQSVRIFIDNSIKYTPAGETITVSSGIEGEYVKITVQDNGIGIPAEDLPHVFDRFFRSDESRARKTGGTGLGLAIAKWIIDRHGGNVEILSRKDIGTRITLYLRRKIGNAANE